MRRTCGSVRAISFSRPVSFFVSLVEVCDCFRVAVELRDLGHVALGLDPEDRHALLVDAPRSDSDVHAWRDYQDRAYAPTRHRRSRYKFVIYFDHFALTIGAAQEERRRESSWLFSSAF